MSDTEPSVSDQGRQQAQDSIATDAASETTTDNDSSNASVSFPLDRTVNNPGGAPVDRCTAGSPNSDVDSHEGNGTVNGTTTGPTAAITTTDNDSSNALASLTLDRTVNNPGGAPVDRDTASPNSDVDGCEGNGTVNGTTTGPTAAVTTTDNDSSNASASLPLDRTVNNPGGAPVDRNIAGSPNSDFDCREGNGTVNGTNTGPTAAVTTTDNEGSNALASIPLDRTVNNPGGALVDRNIAGSPNSAIYSSEGKDTVNGTDPGPTAADKTEHASTSHTLEDLSKVVTSRRGNGSTADSTDLTPEATAAGSNKHTPTSKITSDLLSVTVGNREGSSATDSSTDLSLTSDTNIPTTLPSCTAKTNCTGDASASPHAATAVDGGSHIASTTLTVDGTVSNANIIPDSSTVPVIDTEGNDTTCNDTDNHASEVNSVDVTKWGNDNVEKCVLNDGPFNQQRGNIKSGTGDFVSNFEHQSLCSGIDQTSVSSQTGNVSLDACEMDCGKSSHKTEIEEKLESDKILNTGCVISSTKAGHNSIVSCATPGQQAHCNRELNPVTGSNEPITEELREQSVADCDMPRKGKHRATPVADKIPDKVTNSRVHQSHMPKLKEHSEDQSRKDGEQNLQGSRQKPVTVVTYGPNQSIRHELPVHRPQMNGGSFVSCPDSIHAKKTSTHQNTLKNMHPAEERGSVVQVHASASCKDQRTATASRAGQKAQNDGQNQTGHDGCRAQCEGQLHTEMEKKPSQLVYVSELAAELLSQEEVWQHFIIELPKKNILISNKEPHKQPLVLLFGKEESLKEALRTFFIETSITVDEIARDTILSMQNYFRGQFTAHFGQTDSQCQICYLRSIESKVAPTLKSLSTFEECISLPLYKVKYCLHHLDDLVTACEREGPSPVQLKVIRSKDGKLCLLVKADRLKHSQIMFVVHKQLAKIVMRETDIATDVGLFLQDDQVANQYVRSIEVSNGCLLSIKMPMQSLQVHAKSPKGQELMLCNGSIADCDCPVLVIPLYEGQTCWPPIYQQILKKGFLPEEVARYLNEVGSPEQKMKNYTMTLDCNKDLAGRKVVVMFVAGKDRENFQHYLSEACAEALKAAFLSNSSVALPVEDDTRSTDKAWKLLLHTVKSTLESCTSAQQVKLFLNMQTPCALELCRHMEDYLVRSKWTVLSYFKQDSRDESRIRVVVDDLQDIEADVYVNSTDGELKHEKGLISKILLTKAGEFLTAQCREIYPEGIVDNVVARTESFNLKNFQWIFHIVLPGSWQKKIAEKQLQELKIRVQACLALASELRCRTIALPTLGLGMLEYPPVRVAKTMFSAAREFFTEMPHSTLERVSIMCYHKDHYIIQVFKVEEALCNPRKQNIFGRTFEIKKAQVIIIQGDLRVLELGANITVCGPHLKGSFEDYKKKSEANGSIVLQWTSKKAKDVVKQACKLCLEDRKRVSLQIDMQTIEQGWHDEMITALTRELHDVLVVYLVVASNGDLHAVAEKLRNVASNSKSKWSNFWSLVTLDFASNDTTESGGTPAACVQEEDRGSVQIIGPWRNTWNAENNVLSVRVPEPLCEEYTTRAHEYKKKKREESSVDQKTSQSHEGIEHEIKDAMREGTVEESSSGGPDTRSFTIPVDRLEKVDRGIIKQCLEQETKGMSQGYSEEELVSLVWRIVRKLSGVQSGNSQTIVAESQTFSMDFDILEHEALKHLLGPPFSELESNVNKDSGKVSVCSKGEKPTWFDKCSLLRREDVQLPYDELARLGQEPLDTRGENLEAFIKPLHDEGKVAILTFDYNAITKAKHLVSVRAGKVKVTARARRRFESAGQGEHSPPQSIDSLSSKSVAVDPKEFSTKSGIKVHVYKTDITKLPVDAIVNAANDRLSHGGGVAYAIVRAAGMSLEEEGDAYVMRNGRLKVTQVVRTTAGSMPCKMVLHAVGPRWDDYEDKVKCQQDLEQTVFNCMVSANDEKCSSLAVSSISSAIFGVPKEMCAQMYLSAVKSFDQKYGKRTSLCVIHFVDVSDLMVSVIQDVFTKGWDANGTAAGGIGTHNIHQVGAPQPEKFYSVSVSSSNQDDPTVTAVKDTRLQQNYLAVHFVNVDLIFVEQRVSGFQADAVVLWQYSDCLLESEDTKQLLQGLTSEVSGLRYKLTNGAVGDVMTEKKLFIFPVISSRTTTKEEFCTLFEQAMEKADQHSKKSMAVSCFSLQPGSKKPMKISNDVAEYAAGIYMAMNKYSDRPHRSVTQVYILETDVNTLRVIEKTVGEMFANDRSMKAFVNSERPQSALTANEGARSMHDTSNRGSNEPQCVICQEKIINSKRMKCGHVFCAKCIDEWMKVKPVCPSCQAVLGILIGNQPTDGTMRMHYSTILHLPDHFAGYEINYSFRSGKQTDKHPNPGRRYHGTSRKAYLPDTPEGRKVLMLLKVAFDRRLVFTVGQSVTTGNDDCVIWNDIHHKTNTSGGIESYGYPDPTYLDRVQMELACKGVTYDVLTWKQKDFIQNPKKYFQYPQRDFFCEFCSTDI